MNIPRSISQPRKTSCLLHQVQNALLIIMNIPRSISQPRKTSSLLHQLKTRHNSREYSSFYRPATQNKFAFTQSRNALIVTKRRRPIYLSLIISQGAASITNIVRTLKLKVTRHCRVRSVYCDSRANNNMTYECLLSCTQALFFGNSYLFKRTRNNAERRETSKVVLRRFTRRARNRRSNARGFFSRSSPFFWFILSCFLQFLPFFKNKTLSQQLYIRVFSPMMDIKLLFIVGI